MSFFFFSPVDSSSLIFHLFYHPTNYTPAPRRTAPPRPAPPRPLAKCNLHSDAWQERQRRQRSLRTMMMFLMVLLLMDGDEPPNSARSQAHRLRKQQQLRNGGRGSTHDSSKGGGGYWSRDLFDDDGNVVRSPKSCVFQKHISLLLEQSNLVEKENVRVRVESVEHVVGASRMV